MPEARPLRGLPTGLSLPGLPKTTHLHARHLPLPHDLRLGARADIAAQRRAPRQGAVRGWGSAKAQDQRSRSRSLFRLSGLNRA
ncbi:MAG: hypothetical protein PVG88_02305, partial [Methyloceanibacter sp.]